VESVVGWKEALVEHDLDLGFVVAAGRKKRDVVRVSLYKKGIEGDLFWQASHNKNLEGRKRRGLLCFDGSYQFLYGWEQRCRM
jgi:hypothetical protein